MCLIPGWSQEKTAHFPKTDTIEFVINIDNPSPKETAVFGIYNSLSEDLLKRPNIGAEVYFHQLSWFVEGSFSDGKLFNRNYDIDLWHTGMRKYFNNNYNRLYIELYGRAGHYDTDLFMRDDNGVFGVLFGIGVGVGYKFSINKHWTITPNIRIGFDNFKFKNYYTIDGGNIDVSFGEYIDGKYNGPNDTNAHNTNTPHFNNKTINTEFFKNAYNLYWFGPTYIGVTIQRNIYKFKQ